MQVNFAAGTAEMHVHHLAAEDYFNLPNASIPGTEVDATVSFDVVWSGPVTRRLNVRDAANGFAGTYAENQATIAWSGSNAPGFSFSANPGNFSTSVPEAGPFAELGQERNGIFFPVGPSGPQGGGSNAATVVHRAGQSDSLVIFAAMFRAPDEGSLFASPAVPEGQGVFQVTPNKQVPADSPAQLVPAAVVVPGLVRHGNSLERQAEDIFFAGQAKVSSLAWLSNPAVDVLALTLVQDLA